jgi:hypothetical protein
VLSFSCDDTLGIFASVAAETANSTNLTKALEESSPSFVVRLGTTNYAGIGKLWSKADGATQWALHTVSGVSSSQPFVGSGVVANVVGLKLFVAFADSSSGAGLGVWSTDDGTSWTRADATFPPTGEKLRQILATNNTLFAVTSNDRTEVPTAADPELFSIYYLSGVSFIPAGGIPVTDSSTIGIPTSVASDGTNFWMTAGDTVLTGQAGSLAPAGTQPGGSNYSGIAIRNVTELIISNRAGSLYYSINGGSTWTTAGPFNDSGGDPYSLSAPTVFNDAVLVVGTSSFPQLAVLPSYDGYLEFDVSGGFSAGMTPSADHSLISSAVDFDSSLTTRSVSSMPLINLGGGDFKLFACTDSYGLWSNTYTATTTSWGLWKRE